MQRNRRKGGRHRSGDKLRGKGRRRAGVEHRRGWRGGVTVGDKRLQAVLRGTGGGCERGVDKGEGGGMGVKGRIIHEVNRKERGGRRMNSRELWERVPE